MNYRFGNFDILITFVSNKVRIMKFHQIIFRAILGVVLLSSSQTFAQKKSKESGSVKQLNDVSRRDLANLGTIVENEEIKGYYIFNREQKIGGGMATFKLDMFDIDLKATKAIKMQRPKKSQLVEMSYNGSCFFLLMTNKKGVDMLTYDATGKKLGEVNIKKANKYERGRIAQALASKEGSNSSTYPVTGGFIKTTLEKNKKLGYVIEMYSEKLKREWKYSSNKESDKIETADILYCSDKYVAFLKLQKKNLMTKEVEFSLILLDATDGSKLFDLPMKRLADLSVLGCYIDETKNELYVNGEYFPKGKNIMTSKSEGLYMMKLDIAGKELKMEKMSWKKELLSLTVKDEDKGKSNDNMRFYIHKVHIAPNGNTYIIAEQYKKVVSASAVALNTLNSLSGGGSSNLSNISIKMFNMVYLVLDKDFKLIEKDVVKKRFTEYYLEKGYEFVSATLLAHYIKSQGWFDYQFTSVNKTTGEFSSYYLDYNRKGSDGKKNDAVIGSISLTGEKITQK